MSFFYRYNMIFACFHPVDALSAFPFHQEEHPDTIQEGIVPVNDFCRKVRLSSNFVVFHAQYTKKMMLQNYVKESLNILLNMNSTM
jgi:hypothetical protein